MTVGPVVVEHPRRGRVWARIEALERRLAPLPPPEPIIEGHPLPDLTGAPAEAVADALCTAIHLAHGDDPLWATEEEQAAGARLCPRCLATLDVARRYADPGPIPAWPDPLLRVFEDEFEWRREMDRWADRPGVTFDRTAWRADLDRQRTEHFYTDHYRGQIPPWVILGDELRGRIYEARRAGIIGRLMSTGVAHDRAEALMAAWEVEAAANGLVRDGEAFWDGAWRWLEPRRSTKPKTP